MCLIGGSAFIWAVKKSALFVIYATPIKESIHSLNTLPEEYKKFQDVFEKKNANKLPKHCIFFFLNNLQNLKNHHC
jgi:hypothetical protein